MPIYCCKVHYLDKQGIPQEIHRHHQKLSYLVSWVENVEEAQRKLGFVTESKTCISGVCSASLIHT